MSTAGSRATLGVNGWIVPEIYDEKELIRDMAGIDFCFDAGVTGVNDGSRDDAPLLRAAYASAVAAGAKCLILPVGDVYLKSYAGSAAYPGYYSYQINVSDFITVIPPGCRVHVTYTDNGSGNNVVDAFQISGAGVGSEISRSGVLNFGTILHDTPGMTGTTPNNYACAYHASAYTKDCFYDGGGSVFGFMCTAYGCIDNSSSFNGRISNANVIQCYQGPTQSSSQTTTQGVLENIKVKDFYKVGVQANGNNVRLSGISVFSGTDVAMAASATAIDITATAKNIVINGFEVVGPNATGASTGNSRYGINIHPSVYTAGAGPVIGDGTIIGMDWGIIMSGVVDTQRIANIDMRSCSRGISKAALSGNNCGDTFLSNVRIDDAVYALDVNFNGAATQGLYHGSNVQLTNTRGGGATFNNNGKIVGFWNGSAPPVPMINDNLIQRVASAASVTATAGVDQLTTLLTGTTNTALTPPANPFDGQRWTLRSEGAIATFSFASGTFAGAPSSLTAGYSRAFVYSSAITSWI
jgi:hypothetical protein